MSVFEESLPVYFFYCINIFFYPIVLQFSELETILLT